MEAARLQYKCRLCGERYRGLLISETKAHEILNCIITGKPNLPGGSMPSMFGRHSDCKGGYGVSDIIGYIIEEY